MRDQTVQLPAGNRSTKRQFEEMHGRHSSLPKVSQFHPDYARAGKNGTGVYSNAIKTESENCRSLFCQKEIDCINMENDLKNKNLKTCESAKTICETGTTQINQELVRCKADAAVITTDNSKKTEPEQLAKVRKPKPLEN